MTQRKPTRSNVARATSPARGALEAKSTFDAGKAEGRRIQRSRREAVGRFRRSALDAANYESVLNEAVGLATQALDVELAKVLEYDVARDKLSVRATHGWPTHVAGSVIEHAQETSQAGYALRTGHAIVVEDLRRVDAFRSTQLLREAVGCVERAFNKASHAHAA